MRCCGLNEAADRKIVVSTSGEVPDIPDALVLTHDTPVPVKNLYATPETLGLDRLAGAVGASVLFPRETVLVVDLGTALTFDILTSEGEFLGGNISPGAAMRFRALNEFTGRLPLVSLGASTEDPQPDAAPSGGLTSHPSAGVGQGGGAEMNFPADNTHDAILNGVVGGIVAEVENYIRIARAKWGDVKVIFTGGDAEYFAGRVGTPTAIRQECCSEIESFRVDEAFIGAEFTIFVRPELVFYGLNAILEYNEE